MSLTNDMSAADVAAVTGNNGFGGDGGAWWVILFLFAMMGGGGWGGFGGDGVLPYLYNNATQGEVGRGFDTAALSGQLSGIQSTLAGGEVAACNRAMSEMQTAYTNQIAGMNQSFANAQALDSRLDAIQMTQQQCCCENRAAIADVKYTISNEAGATRAAELANTQMILDKLCALEIDAKNDRISELERQAMMSNIAASQTAQTAEIVRLLTPTVFATA